MDELQEILAQIKARVKPAEIDPALPKCPLCGAGGLAGHYESAFSLRHDCECEAERTQEYLRGLSHLWNVQQSLKAFVGQLPALYKSVGFDSVPKGLKSNNPGLFTALQRLSQKPREIGILYLWGNAGVGKTTLAICVGRAMCESGLRVGFWNEGAWYGAMAEADRTRYSPNPAPFPDLTRYDALILDDLASMVATARASRDDVRALREFYRVLEHYYAERKPLIITSQFDPGVAAQKVAYADTVDAAMRWASRLASGRVFQVTAPRDYRLQPEV